MNTFPPDFSRAVGNTIRLPGGLGAEPGPHSQRRGLLQPEISVRGVRWGLGSQRASVILDSSFLWRKF